MPRVAMLYFCELLPSTVFICGKAFARADVSRPCKLRRTCYITSASAIFMFVLTRQTAHKVFGEFDMVVRVDFPDAAIPCFLLCALSFFLTRVDGSCLPGFRDEALERHNKRGLPSISIEI